MPIVALINKKIAVRRSVSCIARIYDDQLRKRCGDSGFSGFINTIERGPGARHEIGIFYRVSSNDDRPSRATHAIRIFHYHAPPAKYSRTRNTRLLPFFNGTNKISGKCLFVFIKTI